MEEEGGRKALGSSMSFGVYRRHFRQSSLFLFIFPDPQGLSSDIFVTGNGRTIIFQCSPSVPGSKAVLTVSNIAGEKRTHAH